MVGCVPFSILVAYTIIAITAPCHHSDWVHALGTVLSGLFALTLGYDIIYLRRVRAACDGAAKEDFGKKRQQSEMFLFLFLFSLVFLSGVSASTSMAVRGDMTLSANSTGNFTGSVNVTLSLTSGWENLVAYTYTANDGSNNVTEVNYKIGSCYVDGNCFGNEVEVGGYYPGERCSFSIDRAAILTCSQVRHKSGFHWDRR